MVSDIKGVNPQPTNGARDGEKTAAVRNEPREARTERASGPAPDDTVELSGLAEAIRSAVRALADEPAVDDARIRELQRAIAEGSYETDPERIARRLIDADNS